MKYYSTRDKAHARPCSLREAVEAGLAPDGGLFVPERIPQADMAVAERLAGDLVFFSYGGGDISHVGIYVGNNRMLHCGDPIHYASIDTSYWRSHFLQFGRLP